MESILNLNMLLAGNLVIVGTLCFYLLAKVRSPRNGVKVHVSRRVLFGTLSVASALIYLFISGIILDVLRALQAVGFNALVPGAFFTLGALFLFVYLSPHVTGSFRGMITRNFFRHKYDKI